MNAYKPIQNLTIYKILRFTTVRLASIVNEAVAKMVRCQQRLENSESLNGTTEPRCNY